MHSISQEIKTYNKQKKFRINHKIVRNINTKSNIKSSSFCKKNSKSYVNITFKALSFNQILKAIINVV